MSVEREVARAKRAIVFWRILVNVISLPKHICEAIASVAREASIFCEDFEKALFYLELDAARRYYTLTGVDLSIASGDSDRYAGLDPELTEKERDARREEYAESDDDD